MFLHHLDKSAMTAHQNSPSLCVLALYTIILFLSSGLLLCSYFKNGFGLAYIFVICLKVRNVHIFHSGFQ